MTLDEILAVLFFHLHPSVFYVCVCIMTRIYHDSIIYSIYKMLIYNICNTLIYAYILQYICIYIDQYLYII